MIPIKNFRDDFVFQPCFFIMFQVVKQLNCTFSEEDKEHNNDRAISKCLKEADLQKLLRVKVRKADPADPILPPSSFTAIKKPSQVPYPI